MTEKCCDSMTPINIGILKQKWVCKVCDADLNPTEKVGIFTVEKKPHFQSTSFTSPMETMKGANFSTIYMNDQDDVLWW